MQVTSVRFLQIKRQKIMKKIAKILAFSLAVMSFGAAAFFCGCSNGGGNDSDQTQTQGESGGGTQSPSEPQEKEFTGITFSDATYTYDGTERELLINGNLPQGAGVKYTANKAINAGVYKAVAVVSAQGYKTLTLNATLTINKATFKGLSFADRSFVANGKEHSITVAGELPTGSSVAYTDNTATEAGVYNAKAVITNPNYQPLTLNATLTVKSVAGIALDVVKAILNRPDPWSFMPEAFTEGNMAYQTMPTGGVEGFSTFVDTKAISGKFIGKQLNVMYSALNNASTLMGYVDFVFAAGGAIADVYQTYINDNPDDYGQFFGEAGGFKFRITLDGANSQLLAGNATFSAELSYNSQTQKRTGRIQLTDGAALKYEASDDAFGFAVKLSVNGVMTATKLEFERSGNAVVGYLYEYLGAESAGLKTSAVIASNSDYLKITSTKRENDDLLIEAYQEVYDARTGKFIGAETAENVKKIDYDTYWFNLYDVSGINSVKVTDEPNGLNADTVFINGGAEAIHTKLMGTLGGLSKAPSRRFDVEMKEVYYVVAESDSDKTTYKTQKTLIPMLFVQSEALPTFGNDFLSANEDYISVTPVVNATAADAIHEDFAAQKSLLNTVKDDVDYSAIEAFIGQKDGFFAE